MNLRELSEVTFGLIMEGRLPVEMVKGEWFAVPYDKGVQALMQKGATREDVAKVLSSDYINDAHDSVKKWNGIGDKENFDWVKALSDAYRSSEDARFYKKIVKTLEENEQVDWLPIYGRISSRIANDSSGLSNASEINYSEYKPFEKCGYEPIDKVLGGLPSDGPIIIYGITGVGKSTFVTNIVNSILHLHKKRTVAMYTLEMSAEHWMWRAVNMYPSLKEVMDRLYVSGSVKDIDELVAEISAKKVDYVVLDDMDNMVKESIAGEYERVYRRVKEVCRFMKIPFFVLCQPNRAAKFAVENGERFLGRFDVAWSGSAENSAALQIALQVTNGIDMKSQMFPTIDSDLNYIMFWKSRDGWPGDYDGKSSIGPGAIVLEPSQNAWEGKPYGGKWKLWTPSSGKSKIGSKRIEKGKE